MSRAISFKLFIARPKSSAVLAGLMLLLGGIAVSGAIPVSPNRSYIPGHEWWLGAMCLSLAVVFASCAIKGWKAASLGSR